MKLTHKISITVGGVVVVTLGTLLWTTYYFAKIGLSDTLGKQQLAFAQQTIGTIDRTLYQRYADIGLIAEEPAFAYALRSDDSSAGKTAEAQVTRLSRSTGPWRTLSIADTTGIIRFSSDSLLIGTALTGKDKEAFSQALSLNSTVYSDILNSGGTPDMAFAAPIQQDTEIGGTRAAVGIALGHVDWKAINDIFSSPMPQAIRLYDRAGNVLSGSENSPTAFTNAAEQPTVNYALANRDGYGQLPDINQTQQAIISFATEKGFSAYKGLGMVAISESPLSAINAPIATIFIQVGSALLFVVGIIGLILLVFLRRTILRPIKQLTEAAQLISAGHIETQVAIKAKDEFGALAATFNRMSRSLKRSYADLRERNNEVGAERARLAFSINSLTLGFILTDGTDTVTTINGAVTKLLGLPKSPSLENPAPYDFKTLHNQLKKSFNLSEAVKKCFDTRQIVLKRDVLFGAYYFDIFITPIIVHNPEPSVLGTVTLIEDVTEERNLQRSKDEFLSIASHELRTPLTAIRGNASLVRKILEKKGGEPQLQEMVADIHSSSTRLIEIVNDFLDISHIEQGKMEFHPESFALGTLVHEVISEISSIASQKQLTLTIKDAAVAVAFADRNRTKQVIYNLIGNAIKFTDAGEITISLTASGNTVQAHVSDTGHGISKELQGLLFHKFQQASQDIYTRDPAKSTGLGLYISRMLAEGMGGKLELERSVENSGSIFTLTLPAKA